MNRYPFRIKGTKTAFASLMVALLACLSLGCQDRELALSILSVKPTDPESCEPVANAEVFQTDGIVDLVVRNNYSVNLELKNNLDNIVEAKAFTRADSRLSTNSIVLEEAILEYSTLDQLSASIATKKRVPLSGAVTENAEQLLLGFEILDSIMLQQIRNANEFIYTGEGDARPLRTSVTLLIKVTLKGETLDGRAAESNEFLFPVEVCNGCLVRYPPEMLTTRGGALVCPPPMLDPEEDTESEEICVASVGADDGFYNCQTCRGLAVNTFARQLCDPPSTP